jgi:hypothetical protein
MLSTDSRLESPNLLLRILSGYIADIPVVYRFAAIELTYISIGG